MFTCEVYLEVNIYEMTSKLDLFHLQNWLGYLNFRGRYLRIVTAYTVNAIRHSVDQQKKIDFAF